MSDTVVGQQNPGTLGTEYNVLAFVIAQLLAKVQTATLVKVISCSSAGGVAPIGRVVVQPMVFQVSSLQIEPHGEIADVPYFRLQGGTNAVILDPQAGDLGICVFCSRDIANIKADPQGALDAGGATPGSQGQFDWADGLYLGGIPMVGTPAQYVRFAAGLVEVVSPTKVRIAAPTVEINASTLFKVASGATDIEATGDAKVAGATAELQATGAAKVSGASIELAGPVSQTGAGASSFSGSLAAQGTDVHTHHHLPGSYVAGATPVTGNSGNPV